MAYRRKPGAESAASIFRRSLAGVLSCQCSDCVTRRTPSSGHVSFKRRRAALIGSRARMLAADVDGNVDLSNNFAVPDWKDIPGYDDN